MWELGFRHHPELQTKWIKPVTGSTRNFTTWDVTEIMPTAVEMLVEEFPEKAKSLAAVTPESHKQEVKERGDALMNKLEALQAAIENMKGE